MIIETKEIVHKPLKEEVYDALHRQIIAGKYAPGDWLRQEDIANQMGVSMTPAREALDLLVAKGIAERVPYRGVRVREMSAEDVVEAYGMRLLLEALIVRETALNISDDQARQLDLIMEDLNRHVALNEMPQERQVSREFHQAVAEASGNKLLVELYAIVSNAFPDWLLYEALYRYPELVAESMTQMNAEHAAILDAIKTHDADRAVKAALEHVMESGKWLEKYRGVPATLLRKKEKQILHLIKFNAKKRK